MMRRLNWSQEGDLVQVVDHKGRRRSDHIGLSQLLLQAHLDSDSLSD